MSTTSFRLCPADDVPQGCIWSAALPGGRRVALFNVEGRIHVTDDRCTHGEASLSAEGTLTGRVVECPMHFGAFDVTTGLPVSPPCTVPLRVYRSGIRDGDVWVELDPDAATER